MAYSRLTTGALMGAMAIYSTHTQLAFAGDDVAPFDKLSACAHKDNEGYEGTLITWRDENAQPRSVHLIDSTLMDPTGHWGGYARQLTYTVNGTARICRGTVDDDPGFGMVVNHYKDSSENSTWHKGEQAKLLFSGDNHAIYSYRWQYPINGQPVTIDVQWLFVTGQSAPLYAITYDSLKALDGALLADTRAPYGDVEWDGGVGGDVEGVAWGDNKQFISLDSPVTMASGWDYTKDNVVPFVRAFTRTHDAEIGMVQTQTQVQHSAGGYWGYDQWGKRNEKGPMPEAYNWAFQIEQWSLPENTASKRIGWGSNFGAVGSSKYPLIGDTNYASGYPYQSYSVYVTLDRHSQDATMAKANDVAAMQKATLAAHHNAKVLTKGPGGIARNDSQTWDVPGLNPIFNTWELRRSRPRDPMSFSLTPADCQKLSAPTFIIHGKHPRLPHCLLLNGHVARPQHDYFASVDNKTGQLWITLAKPIDGTMDLVVF